MATWTRIEDVPSLKLTARLPLKIGWLEYDPFLLGWPMSMFRGELLVSGRVFPDEHGDIPASYVTRGYQSFPYRNSYF